MEISSTHSGSLYQGLAQRQQTAFVGASDDDKKQSALLDTALEPSSEEARELEALKRRDREVRQHEQAHLAAAGQYAQGAATFTYQRGSDGKNYAVGGEVQIDTSAVAGDPEATIRKMQAVQAAATAPADPSGQDRSVAASAAQTAAQARIDLQRQQLDGDEEKNVSEVLSAQGKASAAYAANAEPHAVSELFDLSA